MRATGTLVPVLASAAALLGGCVHLAPFQPVEAAQAVQGDPTAAAAEVAGVRLTVHAGDWDGSPSDLEETLTPVEVLVENRSGKELDLRPGAFTLVLPTGLRLGPIGPAEVRARLRPYRWGAAYYAGAFGWYPWPGYWRPWPHYYPYVWWGVDVPPVPPSQLPAPSPRGTLLDGGTASMLLFYPVAATSLSTMTLDARLEAVGNVKLGEVRLPLTRPPIR